MLAYENNELAAVGDNGGGTYEGNEVVGSKSGRQAGKRQHSGHKDLALSHPFVRRSSLPKRCPPLPLHVEEAL